MTTVERSFARVDAALRGYLRILPASGFTPLFTCTQVGTQQLSETAQSALPDGLGQYLRSMNEKLDAILSLLTRQTLQEDFPVPVLIHDISGAGLRFSAEREFDLGQGVEIVVALGNQTRTLAGTLGFVIRAEEHREGKVWAVDFKDIRDSEREKIIQFVVATQREQIRERHLASQS